MKIGIGADHRGYSLKEYLKQELAKAGLEVVDFGTTSSESCDYPDIAFSLGSAVAKGEIERGILLCNSGIGMSIAANKVKGVYAGLAFCEEVAELCSRHNSANVLVLPAGYVSNEEALRYITAWLFTPFEGGRHRRRVDKIKLYEEGP